MTHKEITTTIHKFFPDLPPKRYPQEISIFKRLIKANFSERQFWENLEVPFKFNSFACFVKGDGRKFLEEQHLEHLKKIHQRELQIRGLNG